MHGKPDEVKQEKKAAQDSLMNKAFPQSGQLSDVWDVIKGAL